MRPARALAIYPRLSGEHTTTDAVVWGGHGMRNDRGFVLVEVLMDGLAMCALLVVVANMGVQSVIAFPRWSESRMEAQVSVLGLELENLHAQQALHFADRGVFATSLEELRFVPSDGVRMSLTASPDGWSATARHDGLDPSHGCAVFHGAALAPTHPVRPVRRGRVACTSVTPEGEASR